jgi:hypothetical protein
VISVAKRSQGLLVGGQSDGLSAQVLYLKVLYSLAFDNDWFLVSAKIRTLIDFNSRITGQQPPSNAEIITTLKYFTQTLIG